MRLFRTLIPTTILGLLVSEVVLLIACYVIAAIATLDFDPVVYLVYEGNYWKVLFLVMMIVLVMYFQDLYGNCRVTSRITLIQQVCLAVGGSLLALALLGYLESDWVMPRGLTIVGSCLAIILVPLWRVFYSRFVVNVLQTDRLLLLGNSSILAESAAHVLHRPELGYTILGYLCEVEPVEFPVPCLGKVSDLRLIEALLKPTRIVVGMEERRGRMPVQDLLEIRFSGTMIEDAADMYEAATRRVCTGKIQPSQLIFTSELGPRRSALAFHDLYSFVLGLVGLVVTLPLMLLVAIAVRLTSPGPVIYKQRRVGLNGHSFNLYKFRSMYVNAEAGTGAVWAQKDDPRITPLGKWLRRLRLDEMPQFWNVVAREMAIVGPRPERPEFVETLAVQIPYYRQRLAVKPGITGWAQINHKYGDSDLDAMVKLEYDLYYIKHVSLALDAYIIFHTMKVMLLSRGAQ
jgi:sugar transferase (PEP-CTERM system associated)